MKCYRLKYITLIFLLIISTISIAQTNIDSLENVLPQLTDTNRINLLNELAEAYKRISPKKTVEYADEAIALSKQIGNDLLLAISLENAGDGELLLGHIKKAEVLYKESFVLFDKLQDLQGLSNIFLDLGNIKFFNAAYDSAANFYTKSINFKIDLGERSGLISLYNNLGAIYKKTGEFDKVCL